MLEAPDFLDPTTTPMRSNRRSSTARSRYLGARLKALREAINMSVWRLARRLGWSETCVRLLEQGECAVSAIHLARYLVRCYAEREVYTELMLLGRQYGNPLWLVNHTNWAPDNVPSLLELQDRATEVVCFQPGSLPALVCTRDYLAARAIRQGVQPASLDKYLGEHFPRA